MGSRGKTTLGKITKEYSSYKEGVKYETPYKAISYKNYSEMYKPTYPTNPYNIPYKSDYTNYQPSGNYYVTGYTGGYVPRYNKYNPRYDYMYNHRFNYGNSKYNPIVKPYSNIKKKENKFKLMGEKKQKVRAYIPVMRDNEGRIIYGDKFGTKREAISEGMIATDETPAVEFSVISEIVPRNEIKRGRDSNKIRSKFIFKNNRYVEKGIYQGRMARPESKSWRSFNIAPYVYNYN